MSKSIFVVGTDTDVGKTFVAAGLAYILNQNGHNTCYYKPVQSGGVMTDNKFISSDAKFAQDILKSSSADQSIHNTYCFKNEVSPHLAAEAEDVKIDMNLIANDYKTLTNSYDYVIVEGAGGVIVPLERNRIYIYNLIQTLDIPVVIVCKAGVGTINHTALTVNFLRQQGIEIKGLIVNGYTGSFYENDNLSILKDLTDLPVISVINDVGKANSDSFILQAQQEYKKNLIYDSILDIF